MLSSIVLLPLFAQAVFAQTPQTAPISPEFEAYLSARAAGIQALQPRDGSLGFAPAPVSVTHLFGGTRSSAGALTFAPSYDLRLLGRVTSVKNQNPWGTCWAFASYGSLESCRRPGETLDLSEKHLVNIDGFDWGYNDGGNAYMSMAYLCRWGGPVRESDDPYPVGSWTSSPTGLPIQKHIQQVHMFYGKTGPTDNDLIKQAVVDHGAVYVSYYHTDSAYNSFYHSYNFQGSSGGNHAVCVVGWDDNFDRTHFNTVAPANGAYIVKNSWGTGWGESGYFYVSYYDTTFGYSDSFVFVNAEPIDNFQRIYQYDPLGWVTSLNSPWAAAIYSASAAESLRSVGFYAGSSGNYELYIYRDPVPGQPRSGTLASALTGSLSHPGYYTLNLSTPVTLTAGQKFSVVLQLTGNPYPQAVELAAFGYSSAASASAGETFWSFDGTSWGDLYSWDTSANFCLKAYCGPVVSAPEVEVRGNAVVIADGDTTPSTTDHTSFGTTTVGTPVIRTYTVRNTGTAILTTSGLIVPTGYAVAEGLSASIAPETSDTFTVRLNATAVGTYAGDVRFTCNDSNENPFNFRISGSVITAPEIEVRGNGVVIADGDTTPSITDHTSFGTTTVGTPVIRTYTVRNTGTAILTTSGLIVPTGYSVAEGLSASIAPETSDTFTVRLNATAVGTYAGDVRFTCNDSNENPFNFRISGSVITAPEIEVRGNGVVIADGDTTPSTIDHTSFGTTTVGTPVTRAYTVRNTGTAILTTSGLIVPTGYSVAEGLSASIAPETSDTFTVRLNTTAVGTYAGDVRFTCNDSNENPFNFRISGTVSGAPEIEVQGNAVVIADGDSTPNLLDHTSFDVTAVGLATTRTYRVVNVGTATLNTSGVTVPAGFSLIKSPGPTISAGSADTLIIQLNATSVGLFAGEVSFTCNDSNENPFNFRVSGQVTDSVMVVVDNADSTRVTFSGTWSLSTTAQGYWASNYRHDGDWDKGLKSATFTPNLPSAGTYQVFIWYPARSINASSVPVDIVHADGSATLTVDQRFNGGTWNLLGEYDFAAGTAGYVRVRTTGTTGYVLADAVKFVRTGASDRNTVSLGTGTIAGQTITPANREVRVSPGALLSGSFSVVVHNGMSASAIAPVACTPTWGEPESSFWEVHPSVDTGDTTQIVSMPPGLTAPIIPGTYHLAVAMGGTYYSAQLMSGTHPAYPADWENGNIVARLPSSDFEAAAADGWIPFEWYKPGGSVLGELALTSIRVVVQEANFIVDNADSSGMTFVGVWSGSTTTPGYWASNYSHDGNTDKGSKTAKFTPNLPVTGTYEVFMRHPSRSDYAANVPVDIVHASGTKTVTVDQRVGGGTWKSLGIFRFNSGGANYVLIRTTGTSGYVVADAVKFVPVSEIVLDNTAVSGVTYSGSWTESTTTTGYWGSNYRHDGNSLKGNKTASFSPTLPTTQAYQVFMWYPSRADYASNVPVDIVHADGTSTVTVNQSANGRTWTFLGTYNFRAGTTECLRIRTTGTTGYVVADAVKWVTAASPAPEDSPGMTKALVSPASGVPEIRIDRALSGNLWLEWPSLPGTTYSLEKTTDGGTTWQQVFQSTAELSTQSFEIKPDSDRAFFRLVVSPSR